MVKLPSNRIKSHYQTRTQKPKTKMEKKCTGRQSMGKNISKLILVLINNNETFSSVQVLLFMSVRTLKQCLCFLGAVYQCHWLILRISVHHVRCSEKKEERNKLSCFRCCCYVRKKQQKKIGNETNSRNLFHFPFTFIALDHFLSLSPARSSFRFIFYFIFFFFFFSIFSPNFYIPFQFYYFISSNHRRWNFPRSRLFSRSQKCAHTHTHVGYNYDGDHHRQSHYKTIAMIFIINLIILCGLLVVYTETMCVYFIFNNSNKHPPLE